MFRISALSCRSRQLTQVHLTESTLSKFLLHRIDRRTPHLSTHASRSGLPERELAFINQSIGERKEAAPSLSGQFDSKRTRGISLGEGKENLLSSVLFLPVPFRELPWKDPPHLCRLHRMPAPGHLLPPHFGMGAPFLFYCFHVGRGSRFLPFSHLSDHPCLFHEASLSLTSSLH